MKEALITYLITKIASIINKSNEHVSIDQNFMDMGLESNQMIGMTKDLEKDLGVELYPTLFFENQNIEDLSNYFLEDYSEQMNLKFGNSVSFKEVPCTKKEITSISEPSSLEEDKLVSIKGSNSANFDPLYFGKPNKDKVNDLVTKKTSVNISKDVAIVGMSGYFPGSKDINEFWENISQSKDLIKEIPEDHWDYRPWFSEDRETDKRPIVNGEASYLILINLTHYFLV